MSDFKVGDRVEWERRQQRRHIIRCGIVVAISDDGCSALIDRGKYQRRERVYLSRLRPTTRIPLRVASEVINRHEYGVLVKVWNFSPSEKPRGVQHRTMANLVSKGLLACAHIPGSRINQYWLTEEGKRVMDEFPHTERLAGAAG